MTTIPLKQYHGPPSLNKGKEFCINLYKKKYFLLDVQWKNGDLRPVWCYLGKKYQGHIYGIKGAYLGNTKKEATESLQKAIEILKEMP